MATTKKATTIMELTTNAILARGPMQRLEAEDLARKSLPVEPVAYPPELEKVEARMSKVRELQTKLQETRQALRDAENALRDAESAEEEEAADSKLISQTRRVRWTEQDLQNEVTPLLVEMEVLYRATLRAAMLVVRYRVAALAPYDAGLREQIDALNSKGAHWRSYYWQKTDCLDIRNVRVSKDIAGCAERVASTAREVFEELPVAKAEIGCEPRDLDQRLF
jgi:hypothetical protein